MARGPVSSNVRGLILTSLRDRAPLFLPAGWRRRRGAATGALFRGSIGLAVLRFSGWVRAVMSSKEGGSVMGNCAASDVWADSNVSIESLPLALPLAMDSLSWWMCARTSSTLSVRWSRASYSAETFKLRANVSAWRVASSLLDPLHPKTSSSLLRTTSVVADALRVPPPCNDLGHCYKLVMHND